MEFKPFADVEEKTVSRGGTNELQPTSSTMTSSKIDRKEKHVERQSSVAYDVIRLLKTWNTDGDNKYSPEDIAVAVQQVVAQKRYSSNMRKLIIIAILFFVAGLATLIAGIVYGVHELKQSSVDSNDTMLNPKDGKPLRMQQHYQSLPIGSLNFLPLEQVEKLESIVLQWGESGSDDEVKYYYNVESASRKGRKGTRLRLSSGHSLVVKEDNALLYNEKGEIIGELKFNTTAKPLPAAPGTQVYDGRPSTTTTTSGLENDDDEKTETTDFLVSQIDGNSDAERRLKKKSFGKYGKLKHKVVQDDPLSFFDAYCKYGCGAAAVTFPYHYRPFFGYGFPLVGTEAMFPAGYGGNPGTQIMASQSGVGGVAGRNPPVLSGGVPVSPAAGTPMF